MAKATLPTNFKDDILANGMSGKRRYNIIQNSDGTISLDDVTDYTQVGSTFGAAQINATNKAVNNAADASKIIDDLDAIKANTQSGYIAGALAVKALDSNLGIHNIVESHDLTDGAGGTHSITINQNVKNCLLILGWYSTAAPAKLSNISIDNGTLESLIEYSNSHNRIIIYKITANKGSILKITPSNNNFGAPYLLILN